MSLFESIGLGIGVIASIITIVTGLYVVFDRRKKTLSVEPFSSQILDIQERKGVEGKIQILYEDTRVETLHLTTLKFYRTGKGSISKDDYERPIKLTIDENIQILSAKVSDTRNKQLIITPERKGNEITISRTTLNENDWFTIQILTTKSLEIRQNHLDYRIKDIEAIKIKKSLANYSFLTTPFGFLLAVIMGIVGATLLPIATRDTSNSNTSTESSILLSITCLMLMALFITFLFLMANFTREHDAQ